MSELPEQLWPSPEAAPGVSPGSCPPPQVEATAGLSLRISFGDFTLAVETDPSSQDSLSSVLTQSVSTYKAFCDAKNESPSHA